METPEGTRVYITLENCGVLSTQNHHMYSASFLAGQWYANTLAQDAHEFVCVLVFNPLFQWFSAVLACACVSLTDHSFFGAIWGPCQIPRQTSRS